MIEVPVSSLVTEAPTVPPETVAVDAASHLRRPAVPALVVTDEAGAVTGVVTESDVVAAVAEGATNPPVESFMSAPVVTVSPDTNVGLAADRMRDAGVGLLPVVDEGSYRGVVSKAALAPYLSRHRLEVSWQGEPLSLDESDDPPGEEVTGTESSDARVGE